MILCIRTLVVTLLLFSSVVESSKRSKQQDKLWKTKKRTCEQEDCVHLLPEEGMNCVNNCTSPACWTEIYGNEPLEDGEIDNKRNREFMACVRKESKALFRATQLAKKRRYEQQVEKDM